ncbi:putative membrane-associated phospholipid phosphatase [unidentified eubacterium SCB49]|nr:putative membrane-associated phospholipid phosphatase [unidentified eubacterium SCB49]
MLQTLKEWDWELLVWLNSIGIEDWDSFWLIVTKIETWIPLFVFFFILIFYYYKFKKGIVVLFSLFATAGITIFITEFTKEYVARLRPNNVEALGDLIRVLLQPENYSFFSGHASSSFAITTFVVLSLRKYNRYVYLFYLWPLLFIMSRIYVGVHYPSDILVGAIVGMLIGSSIYFVAKKRLGQMSN